MSNLTRLEEALKNIPPEDMKVDCDCWDRMEVSSPIDTKRIPHFVEWINFNRFADDHKGLDFGFYLNKFGEAVIGLPKHLPVYSMADGIVACHLKVEAPVNVGVVDPYDHYLDSVVICHGRSRNNKVLLGIYSHTEPSVKQGKHVSKGQRIGNLFADPGGTGQGRLVHLHLGLEEYNGETQRIDPNTLFKMDLTAVPQREVLFDIEGREEFAEIRVANYRTLRYGQGDLHKNITNSAFSAPKPTYSIVERIKEMVKG